jgi:hypothetical protein
LTISPFSLITTKEAPAKENLAEKKNMKAEINKLNFNFIKSI